MDPGTPDEIEGIISALSRPDVDRALRPSVPGVAIVAGRIANEPELLERLYVAAVGEGTGDPAHLLKQIVRVEPALGFSEHATLIAGHILAHGMQTMSHDEKASLLSLVNTDAIHFFNLLRALPTVFTYVSFRADYVISWIEVAHERIRNDLAQGDFWRSIESWALKDPTEALQGLRLLCQSELNDNKIAVAATILGTLRVTWEKDTHNESGLAFERSLRRSRDVHRRLVFLRSWINTGWNRGLSAEEFSSALTTMTEGTAEEKAEAFNFLRCLLPHQNLQPESVELGLRWLSERADSAIPDQAKYWVVTIVHRLFAQNSKDPAWCDRLWRLLVAIQPTPAELKGIWQEIEHLLVDLTQVDQVQFEALVGLLLRANENAVKHYFGSVNTFQYLYSELTRLGRQDFYAAMFFSTDRAERELAFAMFDRLPFDSFPAGMLESKSDDEIALCIFQSRLHHLDAAHVAALFVMLIDRAQSSTKAVANLFQVELLYQAKNFPASVLERIRKIETPSTLIASVVADANSYFDRLDLTHNSALKAMHIPGWRRAAIRQSARQRRDIDDKSDESSSLLGFFHKSYLLYGSEGFRSSRDGEVGELATMQTMSAEVQLPRMLMIDPEGAALRRRESIRATKALAAKITGTPNSDT